MGVNKTLRLRSWLISVAAIGVFLVSVGLPNAGRVVEARRPEAPAHDDTPYLEYHIYQDTVVTDLTMPPVLSSGQADYAQIFSEHNLCALVQAGEIDEVWIWTGNGDGVTKAHLWEWTTSGPAWTGSAPNCGKVVTTMAFNYLREVDVALESYHHRLEGLFSKYFPCDFSTATWPWTGGATLPFSNCGAQLSDRYGFVARPFAGNDSIGACGDAHHPPNILDAHEYDYSSAASVSSICTTWSQDGSAQPAQLDCAAWGCSHWGFHQWWMQNVPGLDNINRDRAGVIHPNWWSYLFGVPTPSSTATPAPTDTPTATSTPTASPPPPPDPEYALYLPALLRSNSAGQPAASTLAQQAALSMSLTYATEARDAPAARPRRAAAASVGLISPRAVAEDDAVTMRTVYVIYYPGYGGAPRADITLLTAELIGLLKEATIYHGYEVPGPQGVFIGQDGGSFAGQGCSSGTVPDNIHIRLPGLRTDITVASYQVDDAAGGGRWATPCNPVSNWLVVAQDTAPGQVELYFKPFRNAPAGTIYAVYLRYQDGTSEQISVVGGEVRLTP